MRVKWAVVVFFCICFGLLGCETTSSKKNSSLNSGLLEPQASAKFNDIPVPVGFKLVPLDSYSFEASGVIRVGLLKYQGKADIDQVVNFYKEQMVMYSWNLLNAVEYGQRILNFDRETETCIINLTANGKNVTSVISIGPKAERVVKRAKPVK